MDGVLTIGHKRAEGPRQEPVNSHKKSKRSCQPVGVLMFQQRTGLISQSYRNQHCCPVLVFIIIMLSQNSKAMSDFHWLMFSNFFKFCQFQVISVIIEGH